MHRTLRNLPSLDFLRGFEAAGRLHSFTRAAEELPPGKYSAFILFWQDPYMLHTSRCRSSEARFVVSN